MKHMKYISNINHISRMKFYPQTMLVYQDQSCKHTQKGGMSMVQTVPNQPSSDLFNPIQNYKYGAPSDRYDSELPGKKNKTPIREASRLLDGHLMN